MEEAGAGGSSYATGVLLSGEHGSPGVSVHSTKLLEKPKLVSTLLLCCLGV